MKVVAVTGTGGGVGVTTVTAHLAAALVANNRSVLALDFSPGNMLRLYFGMEWKDNTGIAPQILLGKPWHQAAYRSAGGVDFVPLGRVCDGDTFTSFDAWAGDEPGWFSSILSDLDVPADTFIICDCSRSESNLGAAILNIARLALIVMAPDAIACANGEAAKQKIEVAGARETAFVLNGFNPARVLDQDVVTFMHTDFQPTLAPVNIHQDESVREALANMQTVFEYAPSCQAAYDFASLATWVVNRLAHVRKETV